MSDDEKAKVNGDEVKTDYTEAFDLNKLIESIDDAEGKAFLTSSTDSKGHSQPMQYRGPPAWARQMEIIMSSQKWPYKTPSDIQRHALLKHFIYLEQLEPMEGSILWKIMAMDAVMKDQKIDDHFEAMLKTMEENVSKHLKAGDDLRAKKLVAVIWGMAESAEDGDLKKSFQSRMKRQFGHLLPKKPMSLLDMQEGE